MKMDERPIPRIFANAKYVSVSIVIAVAVIDAVRAITVNILNIQLHIPHPFCL